MLFEVRFQGGRVRGQAVGPAEVIPLRDRLDAALAKGGQVALDGRHRQTAQTRDLGLGQTVVGQAEDFHPLLDLRAGVVEAVVFDAFHLVRGQFEESHGVLPGGKVTAGRLARKPGREKINA